ncbi:WecB/TagA/CpsF family glycosyltransferase [Streptomyces sp. NPDC001816]|uniref:WecB/TagA/CpsF family glycosyltransferase n=1 Tax=Streptomyces sp. NPDC001816 TaxID=3364612 RepID=UPI0036A8BF52
MAAIQAKGSKSRGIVTDFTSSDWYTNSVSQNRSAPAGSGHETSVSKMHQEASLTTPSAPTKETTAEWQPDAVPVVGCLGIPIAAHDRRSAARQVVQLAELTRRARPAQEHKESLSPDASRRGGGAVHLCNAYTLALAAKDAELHALLRSAALNLPDGQSVVWANQLLHRTAALPSSRVCGTELLLDVFALGQTAGLRHYLLGSTREVLAALQRELHRRFPHALIVGACSPPFRPLTATESFEQEEAIRKTGADVVWVGLGTPQQDRRTAELAAVLPSMCVAVGAAFDFIAGHRRRAPRWMQRWGMEWLFRLTYEPRRLWRRYLFGNTRFVHGVIRQHLRQRVASGRGAG